jgi:hypothetical protein
MSVPADLGISAGRGGLDEDMAPFDFRKWTQNGT